MARRSRFALPAEEWLRKHSGGKAVAARDFWAGLSRTHPQLTTPSSFRRWQRDGRPQEPVTMRCRDSAKTHSLDDISRMSIPDEVLDRPARRKFPEYAAILGAIDPESWRHHGCHVRAFSRRWRQMPSPDLALELQ
jgi:hypothetical protein